MRPLILGVFAALFFASTFVLNEAMHIGGGHWAYSASLRFLFMIPLLVLVVAMRGGLGRVRKELASDPVPWLVWGTVGFGLFYVPICIAAVEAPPWLIAAFAYPLGNRKMMAITDLDVFERILGMCVGSLPVWLLLFGYGLTTGVPSGAQVSQTLLVALLSGVIATVLFFKATDLVKHDMGRLATVEATQALEVLFALVGEILILQAGLPSGLSLLGIGIVMLGVTLHSRASLKVMESSVAIDRFGKEG